MTRREPGVSPRRRQECTVGGAEVTQPHSRCLAPARGRDADGHHAMCTRHRSDVDDRARSVIACSRRATDHVLTCVQGHVHGRARRGTARALDCELSNSCAKTMRGCLGG